MMMRNPTLVDIDVFVDSPNRSEPHTVQNAIDVVANTIAKIPEMDVKFEGDSVLFKTSYSARMQDHAQVQIEFEQKMDEIAAIVLTNLKNSGYSSAKLTKEYVDVTPGMWRFAGSGLVNRQMIYTVCGVYKIEV